ncbi:hypothetical protein QO218_22410, partial [Vibrio vulnificus]|nr:hypothetical protein [Vibrio vulnificus]
SFAVHSFLFFLFVFAYSRRLSFFFSTVAMLGATGIVAPLLPHYPNISPEIITLAIGSGAIGCTIVTDSLFWLVKQYCGASITEIFKYYTSATFIASFVALAGTFLLSYIV